jgi:cytochrome c-type biogenesis protein CcmH
MSLPGFSSPLHGKRTPGGLLVLLALAFVALLATPPAAVAAPQASLADVEDEVMCPICGTLLELAGSPQAQRQRVLIRRMIAGGSSKAEIKEALVTQYGDEVLALPRGSGFDLTAYLVPAFAFVLAVLALALGVRRWRRAGGPPRSRGGGTGRPQGEDAERLEADLARYDL